MVTKDGLMDVVQSLVQHLLSLLLFSFSCWHTIFFVFKVFFWVLMQFIKPDKFWEIVVNGLISDFQLALRTNFLLLLADWSQSGWVCSWAACNMYRLREEFLLLIQACCLLWWDRDKLTFVLLLKERYIDTWLVSVARSRLNWCLIFYFFPELLWSTLLSMQPKSFLPTKSFPTFVQVLGAQQCGERKKPPAPGNKSGCSKQALQRYGLAFVSDWRKDVPITKFWPMRSRRNTVGASGKHFCSLIKVKQVILLLLSHCKFFIAHVILTEHFF